MRQKKQLRRYNKDLGHFLAEGVLRAILISCISAVIMVATIAMIVIPSLEDLTPFVICALALFVCCLTVCLTGAILFVRTKKITTPITRVNDAITKIASGDFAVRIQNDKKADDRYQYENELDELTHNLNKMLQMSRLDHQEIISAKDSVRIDEQLRKCMILLSEKWQEKNIEFVPELEEVTLVTDKNLMMQVWINLIDNAMKYSEANKKIHITLTKLETEIYIVICDEGIGIPKDKMDKIYNRFYQCEESHKKQGAGLGLAIVKRILDLLHGTIHYDSEQGKGTKVTVVLK